MKLNRLLELLVTGGACLIPSLLCAQTAVVGSLANYDAANFEGKDVHGMEVQIEGIVPGDLSPSWCGNKYGCPVIIPYATGVYVRYQGIYDATNGIWQQTTVPHPANTPFAGTCYMVSASYNNAGCDHFGVHLLYTANTKAVTTAYRWMVEDPANPGTLIASQNNIFVPTPVYSWIAPAVPTTPPVLQAEIRVPPPPPPPPAVPPQYGNATWMKVFKTEMSREVALDELTGDNPIVPQNLTQIETEWTLVQAPPPGLQNGHKQRNRQVNQGGINAGTRAVLRRYETYAYTGSYDPASHEAVCGGDGTCNAPLDGELGDMLTAQMTAANVAVPSLSVTVTGTGTVSSSDNVIACGNKCTASYPSGTVVTLTAKPGSNWTLSGWTGACSGTALTCTVSVTDSMTAAAQFTAVTKTGGGGGGGGGGSAQFNLQVGKSNSGTVTSDVSGISCGSTCAAKFNAGAVVTLTATPPSGKSFLNWSGACSGTSNVCAVTMNSNSSVQAVFSK